MYYSKLLPSVSQFDTIIDLLVKKGKMERGTLKYLWLGFALIFAPAQAEVFYSYTDHLGSGGLRTDPTGEVQQITQYLPFGETLYEQHSTL
ncbi:MAG: hypothetical protein HY538_05685, partial [Deltaproteobacteria bacterium]|nr:hypothetical protein [Deltaproteobacteria bacterium]